MPKLQDVLDKYTNPRSFLDSSLGGDETQPVVTEATAPEKQWIDKEGLKKDLAEVKQSYKSQWQLCIIMILGLYLLLLVTVAINLSKDSFLPLLGGLTIAGASAPFLINKMFDIVRSERDTERLLVMSQHMDTKTLKDIVVLMKSQSSSPTD